MVFKKILHVFEDIVDSKNKRKLKEVNSSMRSEFVNSISFEEDPFEDEMPEMMQMFDLDGNEVES